MLRRVLLLALCALLAASAVPLGAAAEHPDTRPNHEWESGQIVFQDITHTNRWRCARDAGCRPFANQNPASRIVRRGAVAEKSCRFNPSLSGVYTAAPGFDCGHSAPANSGWTFLSDASNHFSRGDEPTCPAGYEWHGPRPTRAASDTTWTVKGHCGRWVRTSCPAGSHRRGNDCHQDHERPDCTASGYWLPHEGHSNQWVGKCPAPPEDETEDEDEPVVTTTTTTTTTAPPATTTAPPATGCAATGTRLSSLTVTPDQGSNLLSGFSASRYSYVVAVPETTSSVNVKATAAGASATVAIGRGRGSASSASYRAYPAQGSSSSVSIKVTSGGQSCTYSVTVTRGGTATECRAWSGQWMVNGVCVEACPGSNSIPVYDDSGVLLGCDAQPDGQPRSQERVWDTRCCFARRRAGSRTGPRR